MRGAGGAAVVSGRGRARRLPERRNAVRGRGGAAHPPLPADPRARSRRADRLEHHRLRRAGADPAGGRRRRAAGAGPGAGRAPPARQRRPPVQRLGVHPGPDRARRHPPAARGRAAPAGLQPGDRLPPDPGRGQDLPRRRSRCRDPAHLQAGSRALRAVQSHRRAARLRHPGEAEAGAVHGAAQPAHRHAARPRRRLHRRLRLPVPVAPAGARRGGPHRRRPAGRQRHGGSAGPAGRARPAVATGAPPERDGVRLPESVPQHHPHLPDRSARPDPGARSRW